MEFKCTTRVDYTGRARVILKLLFVPGEPNHRKLMGDINYFDVIITVYQNSNPNPNNYYFCTNLRFLERDGKADGRTRTHIDVVGPPYTKSTFGAITRFGKPQPQSHSVYS